MPPLPRLLAIMEQLRDKDSGCPWDVKQTHESIAACTIEEAHEVTDAILSGDRQALKEELGDLLLQVVFHSQMAKESGTFDFDAVAESIAEKMIRRHPHVFGHGSNSASIETAEAQTQSWEQIKAAEAAEKGEIRDSMLDGISPGLPPLMRAVKLQKRAAKTGFDWPDAAPIFDKLQEEAAELQAAMALPDSTEKRDALEDELGDLLFVCTNLARHLKLDPDIALQRSNRKFEFRFRAIEALAQAADKPLQDYTLDEMEMLWQRVKRGE